MKKVAVLLLAIITVSSCSLFKKPSMTQEQIDALINQKAAVEEELINVRQEYDLLKIQAEECTRLMEQQTMQAVTKGKYYVIAGSFKNNAYAEEFSARVKQLGGAGNIIAGPYDFNLVVYSVHETLKEAANSMYLARTNISDDSWVYKGK